VFFNTNRRKGVDFVQISGIIAEYNPFHNGHAYLFEQTRAKGATHIVVIMSGSFVQRSEPALFTKFDRAAAAVRCGADLVLELPAVYAGATSERFAFGGVSILNSLGVVDTLCFGSECGDIDKLQKAARAVVDPDVVDGIKRLCEIGYTYPEARMRSVSAFYGSISELLRSPNDLLAVDYIKAINRLSSKIKPIAVKRIGAGHDEDIDETDSDSFPDTFQPVKFMPDRKEPKNTNDFASGRALREIIRNGGDFERYMPTSAAEIFRNALSLGRVSEGTESLEKAILIKARRTKREQLNGLPECSDGLGDRIYNAARTASTLGELYELAKTKRYTMSRVRRSVLGMFFDFDKELFTAPPYARILAIGKGGREILRAIKEETRFPVSQNLGELAEKSEIAAKFAEYEILTTDAFALTLKKPAPAASDLTQKLFVLNNGE